MSDQLTEYIGSGVHQSAVNGRLIIAATSALYAASAGSSSSQALGVFLSDTYLDQITDILSTELNVGKSGVVYVYERNLDLIAASKGQVT